ncbi:MAG TPA: hypothetical protein VK762_35305, partial [Polyangiaceae bacterium]|nr:hypothetical protein [Polyangiaceae bacterium]
MRTAVVLALFALGCTTPTERSSGESRSAPSAIAPAITAPASSPPALDLGVPSPPSAPPAPPLRMTVRFYDVGQGLAALVEL